MAAGSPIGAAVDVGSNSVHLLVARIRPGGLEYLRDESVLLGLGDIVDRAGSLPADARGAVVEALTSYRQAAEREGARLVTFVGTEPLRRATNAAHLADEVLAATGVPLHVAAPQMEAELTYLGVSGGRPLASELLVVDIGGGSTEVVLARPGSPLAVHSLPSGSARLGNGILAGDPPTPNQLDRLRLGAMALVRDLPPGRPARAVFVGGTATNLVRMVPLTRGGLEEAHGVLASLAESELVERYGINARRARQMPAGAALVEAILSHYGLAEAEASDASLRDGAILARQAAGPDWPVRLSELVGGAADPRR